jgi:hypothetical protein
VIHAMQSGQVPQLSPSVLMYHQVALSALTVLCPFALLHALTVLRALARVQPGLALRLQPRALDAAARAQGLPHDAHHARRARPGAAATAVAPPPRRPAAPSRPLAVLLASQPRPRPLPVPQAEKLLLITRPVNVADLDEEKLKAALASHRAVQSASTYRERSVFVFGDEAGANAMYFELRERMRQLEAEEAEDDAALGSPYAGVSFGSGAATGAGGAAAGRGGAGGGVARWADATAMLKELGMEDYVPLFEEEEMTSMKLLQDIAARVDGEKELMDAFKEIGIKKMGHRQSIVNAVMGLS